MNDNWMKELGWQREAKIEHDSFHRRRRRNMGENETLAEARRRWREQGRCRDCGADLTEAKGTGRRCNGCRAGGNRRKGAKRHAQSD